MPGMLELIFDNKSYHKWLGLKGDGGVLCVRFDVCGGAEVGLCPVGVALPDRAGGVLHPVGVGGMFCPVGAGVCGALPPGGITRPSGRL